MIRVKFGYKGLDGVDSHCQLEIKSNVVIATEAHDNLGSSITTMAECLASQVDAEYEIPLKSLIWIEHYPALHSSRGETYDLVQFSVKDFELISPRWVRISPLAATALFNPEHEQEAVEPPDGDDQSGWDFDENLSLIHI